MKYNANHKWVKEFTSVIVVCDKNGIIIEMNDKVIEYICEVMGYNV